MEQEIKTLNDLVALGLGDCELRINGKLIKDCEIIRDCVSVDFISSSGETIVSVKKSDWLDIFSYTNTSEMILNDCS